MELCVSDELVEIDETEWIERRRHELILRKYRQNTQRLVKELQIRIQQQNVQIQQLAKEVKRQKVVIDTFENETTKASDDTQHQIVADNTRCVEFIKVDSKPTTIIYLDSADVDNGNQAYQSIEVKCDNVHGNTKPYQTKRKIDTNQKSDSTNNKKLSLVSIQIQPNLRDATNVYVCDECNKTMSSRRVLAVRI